MRIGSGPTAGTRTCRLHSFLMPSGWEKKRKASRCAHCMIDASRRLRRARAKPRRWSDATIRRSSSVICAHEHVVATSARELGGESKRSLGAAIAACTRRPWRLCLLWSRSTGFACSGEPEASSRRVQSADRIGPGDDVTARRREAAGSAAGRQERSTARVKAKEFFSSRRKSLLALCCGDHPPSSWMA